MPVYLLALLGLCAGVLVEAVVSSYHYCGRLTPRLLCRGCGCPHPAASWIPIAGALLHKSCAACGRPTWFRALQIEVATAVAFSVLAGQYWGQPLLLLVSLAEAALLVAVLFIDLELRLIPNLLIVLLVLLALGSAAAWPGLGLWNAVLGGVLGYASFGVLVVAARFVFGEGAFGLGDANLALAIGCITGYPLVVFALSSGVFLGGLGAVFMVAVARRGLRSTMPYGPYLVLAVLYVLAHGNTLNPLVHL
jgi:leader peptidase (prepilin peptidase)/N-methyltransferase